jgi:hypothetical protein
MEEQQKWRRDWNWKASSWSVRFLRRFKKWKYKFVPRNVRGKIVRRGRMWKV